MLKKVFEGIKFVLLCIYATLYIDPKDRFENGYYEHCSKNEINKFNNLFL